MTDKNKSGSSVEVADIFREHFSDYQERYNIPPEHYKVVYNILNCRTPWLGGHIEKCDHCSEEKTLYNSCRDRHCPKCQVIAKERWLDARKAELLPIIYFHNVFTLPHELNPIILCNKKVMLTILFRSVSETLHKFGLNPDNGLGGKLGFTAILHTWDQLLNGHFHLHCLVPGGALSLDKSEFILCENDYLFPIAALSKVYRGKFMDYFKQAYEKSELIFPGATANLGTKRGFKALTNTLWSKDWVVDIQDPIKKPEYVLEYLARYTHRVAISNDRIQSLEDGKVIFNYKDRETNQIKETTIDAVEFIRRFLLHVLPSRFTRIRHYGFLANRCKKENIGKIRLFLGLNKELPDAVEKSVQELMLTLTGVDTTLCQVCGKGRMKKRAEIPKYTGRSSYEIIHPPN